MKNYIKLISIFLLGSCSVVEDYKFSGETTYKGTMEYEFHLHEHFKTDDGNECFYYHDTLVEDWEFTIENIIKTKKLIWNRKNTTD
jgi:hypothetical protein